MLPLLLGPLPRSRRSDAAGAARAARPGPQAESSERPLRRRAARMARPARVRMRRRKPWVLARRRLFGWKVRLLTLISVTGRTRVVRRCWRGRPASAAIGSPRSRSRACENGRQGLAYGTRAPPRGSNQHCLFRRRVRLPAAPPDGVATRRARPRISVLSAHQFPRSGCSACSKVVSVPRRRPDRADLHRLWKSVWTDHNGGSVARPRRARPTKELQGC